MLSLLNELKNLKNRAVSKNSSTKFRTALHNNKEICMSIVLCILSIFTCLTGVISRPWCHIVCFVFNLKFKMLLFFQYLNFYTYSNTFIIQYLKSHCSLLSIQSSIYLKHCIFIISRMCRKNDTIWQSGTWSGLLCYTSFPNMTRAKCSKRNQPIIETQPNLPNLINDKSIWKCYNFILNLFSRSPYVNKHVKIFPFN
jgi:hypothetical protein